MFSIFKNDPNEIKITNSSKSGDHECHYFLYKNEQYFCDVKLLLDENKNFDFIDDVNKEIINLIIYDMKNFIGLEISEYDMLNIISSQPRR